MRPTKKEHGRNYRTPGLGRFRRRPAKACPNCGGRRSPGSPVVQMVDTARQERASTLAALQAAHALRGLATRVRLPSRKAPLDQHFDEARSSAGRATIGHATPRRGSSSPSTGACSNACAATLQS